jgi:hypothetical protein
LTLTLNKSISAVRLNQKSGVPYSEPEVNIPFGAILSYKGSDRDSERFIYMSELYRAKRDVLASAVDGGKIPEMADDAPAASAMAGAAPKPAMEVKFKFEKLSAGVHSISRAKVPGGWIVMAANASITFYPDPEHAWDGATLV